MNEEILRRILVAKHLLTANSGQLTPTSDAVAVARMVLVAHDAAELALAAIASHLNVTGLPRETFLMSYPDPIEETTGKPLSGKDFLRQLNAARIGFKHLGILPDARTWYRVIERVWERTDDWCQAYLGAGLDGLDLESLLANQEVREVYANAKVDHAAGRDKVALESLAYALYRVLFDFPGMRRPPTVGRRSTEDTLVLSAFGVKASDYLTLQDLLPHLFFDMEAGGLKLDWQQRETGHEGNWTADNVRFCLETFLDLALKAQHAAPVPVAFPYLSVFDDTITPRGASADLFEYVREEQSPYGHVIRVKVVRILQKGETLRCYLSAHKSQEAPTWPALSGLAETPLEQADVLAVWLNHRDLPVTLKILYVNRKDVEIGTAPREEEWVRERLPHLFSSPDPATPPPTPPVPARGQGY